MSADYIRFMSILDQYIDYMKDVKMNQPEMLISLDSVENSRRLAIKKLYITRHDRIIAIYLDDGKDSISNPIDDIWGTAKQGQDFDDIMTITNDIAISRDTLIGLRDAMTMFKNKCGDDENLTVQISISNDGVVYECTSVEVCHIGYTDKPYGMALVFTAIGRNTPTIHEDSENNVSADNTNTDDLSIISAMIVSLDQLFTTHIQLGDPVMYKTYAKLIMIYCAKILDELRKAKKYTSKLAKLIRIIESTIDYVRQYDEFNDTNINAIKVFIAIALNEAKSKDY